MDLERLKKMLRGVMTKAEFTAFFREVGRRGGLIGGKRSAAALSPEQRRARAQKAAVARWKQYRAGGLPDWATPAQRRARAQKAARARWGAKKKRTRKPKR